MAYCANKKAFLSVSMFYSDSKINFPVIQFAQKADDFKYIWIYSIRNRHGKIFFHLSFLLMSTLNFKYYNYIQFKYQINENQSYENVKYVEKNYELKMTY